MNKMGFDRILSAGLPATPAYVFDADAFRRRAEAVKAAFGEKTRICFSIKANPFLLPFLPECFEKIEVCSPGELTVCEKTGMDMEKVIFSGVNKTAADVARAMADGVGVFTAESPLHLELIHAEAEKRGLTVPVLLRLTAGSQFGMDEALVLDLIRRRAEFPHTNFVGLHFFSGTQKRKVALIEKELDRVMAFIAAAEADLGFRLERLEYGTGLAVDYFDPNAEEAELARLEAVAPKLRQVAQTVELTVEMGRFFAAPCGYYLTKVMDTKTNCGIHYAIVDGGLNQLKYDGQIQGMQIPVIHQIPQRDAAAEKWTLCGSLCTTADVLTRNAELSGLQTGDTLVFTRTGAYSVMEGMALFLSRELPGVWVYSDKTGLVQLRPILSADPFNTPYLLN